MCARMPCRCDSVQLCPTACLFACTRAAQRAPTAQWLHCPAGVKTNGTKNFIVVDGSMSALIRCVRVVARVVCVCFLVCARVCE